MRIFRLALLALLGVMLLYVAEDERSPEDPVVVDASRIRRSSPHPILQPAVL